MKTFLAERLFAPTDIASLVVFRVAFGAILLWEAIVYFHKDWIRTAYIRPDHFFTYYGFDWVSPWPGHGMYWHFGVMGVAALCVMIGLLYRASIVVFFLSFTYMFLLDQARYLNHFYLVSLIAFMMMFMPMHRTASVDAKLWPSKRRDDAPAWCVWALRWQLGLVYLYAAFAKMTPDWFMGEPVRMWLSARDDYAPLGPLLPIGRLFVQEWFVYLFAWSGLLFDLLVFPALLWRKTRLLAFGASLAFHLTNDQLFDIGMFPWFMICATTIFFAPDWPRRFLNWPRGDAAEPSREPVTPTIRRIVLGALAGWFALQVLFPFRHVLYPGDVHWTEEGHRFAWHMKLRDKRGVLRFHITDPDSGETWEVSPRAHLSRRQVHHVTTRPDMTLQFAHVLADEWRAKGYSNVEVRADCRVSLNGRPRRPMIDPEVNLAAVRRTLGHADWILPLDEPLRTASAGN